jgi:hypothetical protein
MMTNVVAQLVVMIVTNWVGYEGFKLEYEDNITYTLNTTVQTHGLTWQPQVKYDERTECPFMNQVIASTNNYVRIGELIRIEKYVFEDGKELEKSRLWIGNVRQAGRKLMRTEWQWDKVGLDTGKVDRVLSPNNIYPGVNFAPLNIKR